MGENKEEELSLADVYLRSREVMVYLWSRKLVIIVFGIFGTSLGLLYGILKPTEYESRLTFIVDQPGANKGLGALNGIASSFGFGGVNGNGGLYENQVNLMKFIKSRSMMENTLLRTVPGTNQTFADRFINTYEWNRALKDDVKTKSIHFLSNEKREDFSLAKDSVLYEIYKYIIENEKLTIEDPDDEGNIITIYCKFQDDTLTNYFPVVLLNEISNSYISAKTKLAKDNVQILQHQTDSVRSELNQALYNSAHQSDEVFGLNPAFNVRRVPATKEQIDVRASTVLLEELIKNLELARVQLKDETPLIEVIDEPRFPVERMKSGKLKYSMLMGFTSIFFIAFYLIFKRFMKQLKNEAKLLERE
jgi:LPS O-antigen subunit length determinant protein (WzzB/FepE family)